jgi:predicted nucleic acid-binding protein
MIRGMRMVEALVLDASAALAVARQEPTAAYVMAALDERAARNGSVHVPGHFWLELANVLARRFRLPPLDIVEGVRFLDELPIFTVEMDRTLWLLTLQRGEDTGLAAYDAVYLALAETLNADLLTLDADLAAAAGPRAVAVGPRRLAEIRATYAARSPDRVWAEFGSYLAELRREAAAG